MVSIKPQVILVVAHPEVWVNNIWNKRKQYDLMAIVTSHSGAKTIMFWKPFNKEILIFFARILFDECSSYKQLSVLYNLINDTTVQIHILVCSSFSCKICWY
jgi:hypothetical protein